jgi:hypothetical protein
LADDLILLRYGAWSGPLWFDVTAGKSPVPPGSANDLTVDPGFGGAMTGNVSANTINVVPPVIGSVAFESGIISTDFFELSENPVAGANQLTLSSATLDASGTLIVGQATTLDVGAGSALVGPVGPTPGLQDFGTINLDGGEATSDEMNVFGTLELSGGVGNFGTLVVGSYTGPGGTGGIGLLSISAGSSIDVTDLLAVAVQSGTGTIDVNGGRQ